MKNDEIHMKTAAIAPPWGVNRSEAYLCTMNEGNVKFEYEVRILHKSLFISPFLQVPLPQSWKGFSYREGGSSFLYKKYRVGLRRRSCFRVVHGIVPFRWSQASESIPVSGVLYKALLHRSSAVEDRWGSYFRRGHCRVAGVRRYRIFASICPAQWFSGRSLSWKAVRLSVHFSREVFAFLSRRR